MSRLAVFVTGEIRTLEKVAPFFDNIPGDIFAVIQSSNNPLRDLKVIDIFGKRLCDLEWFSLSDSDWKKVKGKTKERLQTKVSQMNLGYLLEGSGSVIEYYQLMLAHKMLTNYEEEKGIKYTHIFKTRCDLAWNEPLDLKMLEMSTEEIDSRMRSITKIEDPAQIFTLFMSSLTNSKLISECLQDTGSYWSTDGEKQILQPNDPLLEKACRTRDPKDVQEYLRDGKYILTFRKNLAYLVPREHFRSVPELGTTYGIYKSRVDSPYWYNAETQFREACFKAGLSIFDYHSMHEEKFMYAEESSLDSEGKIKDPLCLFVLVRH